MRGGKRKRGKAKLTATEISSLKSMVWTRERIAYDLMAINNIPLITRFAVRQSYANNSGTVRALCNGHSCYYNRHTYIYALNLIYLYGYCYVYMHTSILTCATAKL
jgi:hypothetical protein